MSAVEFMQTSGVNFMHTIPRFGHDSNFSSLFSTTQTDQVDYVMGLWAVSFFILSFFIMWGCIIVTFGCMGKRRVGLLAGRVIVVSDDKGDFYVPRHLWKLRVFYVMLCVGIILCNMAIIGPGLRSVETATLSTRKLTREIDDLATQGLLIMDGVSRAEHNIEKLNIASFLNFEDACPNLAGNTFINDEKLISSIASLTLVFNNLEEYVDGSEFEDIRESIDMVMDSTSNIDEIVTRVEMNDWTVKMSLLFLNALVGFMIITTLVSLSGTYFGPLKFVTMILVLPAFVVIVCACWIGAAFISIFGTSNADFCTGPEQNGPDGTVNSILQSFVHIESTLFKAFTYFQSDCTTVDPIEGFNKYETYIETGISSAQTFLAHVEEVGIDEISSQCGASVRSIVESIGLVKENLGILLSALRSTFDLASCSRMRPLYGQAFEDTVCSDSAGSLILMFSLLLGVGCLGMLMIMFRAAMYPCKLTLLQDTYYFPEEDEDEWEEYQAYLRYMTDFLSHWGRHQEDTPSIRKNDSGTKSSSSSEEDKNDIPEVVTCEVSSSWEAESLPPSKNPDYESACQNTNELEPLSPKTQSTPIVATPVCCDKRTPSQNNHEPLEITDEEYQPLSPDTLMMEPRSSRSRRGRLRTPDFLSPGTFRRWRRTDIDDILTSEINDFPQTPTIVSPKEHGTSYFSKALNISNFKSPLSKSIRSPDSDREQIDDFAKTKYF